MTVKLLMDWPDSRDGKNYLAGNLLTTDAGTESGLVAAKMATSTLTGGTAYVPPVVQKQRRPVESEFDELTGMVKNTASSGGKTLDLSKSAANQVGTRILSPSGAGGFSLSSNYTWSLQCALPADFVAVRLVLANSLGVPVTGVTANASVGGTLADRVNNAGAWSNATFSGASSVSLPAGSNDDPSITLSDWIPLQSIDRTDSGSLPLVYLRCMTPVGNANAPLIGFGLAIPGWATKTDAWSWQFQSGDFVTTPSGMTGAADPNSGPIMGVQYLSPTRSVVSHAFFGDSITACTGVTVPGDSWCNQMVNSLSKYASCANLGKNGQTTAQILTRARRYIPLMRPTHAWMQVGGQNSGNFSQSVCMSQYVDCLQFIDLCRQNGTIPILWSLTPRATDASNTTAYYTNAQDNFRKTIAALAVQLDVTYCDFAGAVSDQNALGTASKWASASLTIDGQHLSDVGTGVVSAVALSTASTFA